LMRRSEAMLARDRRHEMRVEGLEGTIAALQQQMQTLTRAIDHIAGRAS
jgi:hypothetical protein